ncbi:MAG TPA: pyridoxal phosphate-dependent aminotransferase [Candidatus Saccharimonadales bacterium]|nr:pyridoxal phosphate-dependent aminotransferase [Candidatus Saccharimonadales bacterium]
MTTTGGIKLADRLRDLRPSATLEVKQTADRLRAQGIDIIDFGPGEPDFDTPGNVKAAAHRAIDENLSHYLPVKGLPALRRAVADFYARSYGCEYTADEIITGCGAKSVLYLAAMALLSPGDEVIIHSPYWVSFPEQVRLAGGVPVILETDDREGFVPDAGRAAALAGPKTRAIILCSPGNPTGAMIPQETVDGFAALSRERNLVLIYDETYQQFLFDGARHSTPAASPADVRDRLLLVSSVSKTYAMTGWRVGYALGPRPLVDAMAKIQGHDATHTAAVAQAAAAEALSGPQDSVAEMIREYARRREVILDGLRGIDGVTCLVPQGAFYVFPNVTGTYAKLGVSDSASVAKVLLEKANVAAVPGEAFGAPGYLRLSYALAIDRIREGIERIRRALG